MDAMDRDITQRIRRLMMTSKSHSTPKHNVKTMSQQGYMSSMGPVRPAGALKPVLSKTAERTGGAGKGIGPTSVKAASQP